jgi:hypothetical protein
MLSQDGMGYRDAQAAKNTELKTKVFRTYRGKIQTLGEDR